MAPPPPRITKLEIVAGATRKDVAGDRNWAAVSNAKGVAIVEATTSPANDPSEWARITWSGDTGTPDKAKANRRMLALDTSKLLTLKAELGGFTLEVNLWVLGAGVAVLTKGKRPLGAAPFDPNSRDATDNLGAVQYQSLSSSALDDTGTAFVDNQGASGKIAVIASLTPKGVSKVVKSGWTIRRQVMSRIWFDGSPAEDKKTGQKTWVDDTSNSNYLRLLPDDSDQIYDLDAPDLRWGEKSTETYNNFKQWVEWHGERCSADALWSWQAQWRVNKDPAKQIVSNTLSAGNIALPSKAQLPP